MNKKWKIKKIFVENAKWGIELLMESGWEPFATEKTDDGTWAWVWLRKKED